MDLQLALEVAIHEIGRAQMERYNSMQAQVDLREAAAVLRAFMEKELPFYRAAEEWARYCNPDTREFPLASAEFRAVMDAYCVKEGK